MLASDAFAAATEEIDAELQRRGHTTLDWRDWDHLHAHMLQNRDLYLTWDRRVLDAGDMLRERFGLRVATPEEYLAAPKATASAM